MNKLLRKIATAAAAIALTGMSLANAQTAICYNCPVEWADWGTQIAAIKAKTGVTVPPDNKNSGQALAQMIAEKASPVADVTYLGVTFGIQAKKDGVVTAYEPANFKDVPAGLKDADGNWVTIHSGTLGFMVNVDALKGKPVPKSWADLLKPEYKGLIGYLDPASAFVGYVGAVAINQAQGGTLDNFGPAIAYFKALQKNEPIVPKQTSYARVLSGEIAILLDYDFNAYRAKYKDHAKVEFVIPAEGTLVVPYVMSLVKNGPNAANGKKVLDFVLSDEGQAIWANAYLRPVRQIALPKEVEARFLPATEYARGKTIDYGKMAEVQKSFSDRYLKEVQ
ncbi:putative spermidine/putrescine transport system substrate-binding protein [Jezberella montanilacus]|jgi:putative spermidine/putrescine transport system substrate-binding protein|uniref:Putative spermidine/putrescine transport system substrate-binding protein n=2 Tax=Jezberella montanilacus TaxID=323426 RepID=A0A2T0XBH1_9BURK|nr:ABC transporter substrate-binding protein [Jezberella montanilacus]PRY96277.1 putative spermidine/putrescine transport system substrate-binding protein [Jezberella montanilacus]